MGDESSESKKDITGIVELSQSMPAESTAPSPAVPSLDPSTEQVDDFASLEQFTKNETISQPEHNAVDIPSFETPPSMDTMEPVKQFSEQIVAAPSSVQAAFPFSLVITGPLTPQEKEKLLDILSREKMGIQEMDLEPQLQSGKILIPRISEYAGVMIIQAMRGTRAKMSLAPSDQMTESALASSESHASYSGGELHPVEKIPTSQTLIPGAHPIDALVASATLRSNIVEAENSSEYQEILEALQREIKYKAYRKGANAVMSLTIQLVQLDLPTHYRLTVTATAARLPEAFEHSPEPEASSSQDQTREPRA